MPDLIDTTQSLKPVREALRGNLKNPESTAGLFSEFAETEFGNTLDDADRTGA